MSDNNTNIFDLVDQVNKNKQKSSMQTEKEMDDIFSMLDDIKTDNNISVDDVRNAVNSYSSSKVIDNSIERNTAQVRKVTVPNSVDGWELYSECVLAYFKAVDYGTDNSKDYVEGHKAAIEKYYKEILNNRKDIYVVEGHVNDEISAFTSKSSIKDKGYYDGLFYVLKSIRKAKSQVGSSLAAILRKKIC